MKKENNNIEKGKQNDEIDLLIKLNSKKSFVVVRRILKQIHKEMNEMEVRHTRILNILKRDFVAKKKFNNGKVAIEIAQINALNQDNIVKLGSDEHFDILFHYVNNLKIEREELYLSYIGLLENIIKKIK